MNLVGYVAWAILGLSLGVLIRSQLGATITAALFYLLSFVAVFPVFGLLRAYVFKTDAVFDYIAILPGVASQVMIAPDRLDIGFGRIGPPWWVGALVLVAYATAASGLGTAIMRKRDIS
jgi:ABC-2 type transport system permease protein